MDSLLTAAARALAIGDPLGALRRVALRDDPPALALRGIAMAQLGELPRARQLLRRAARGFGPREVLARARCAVAEAEVALASRELPSTPRALEAAARTLARRGDAGNAAHAQLLAVRHHLLLGQVDAAARALAGRDWRGAPPAVAALAELARADLARRQVQARVARAALARARDAAARAGIAMLVAEVEHATAALDRPVARLIAPGGHRALALDEVEDVLASADLVVDGCRRTVREGAHVLALARRPVLFALARALGEAWPGDATREALLAQGFGARRSDASHRARLRVELGRLRCELRGLAAIEATARGFALRPHRAVAVVVLAPPADALDSALLALLADGQPWSTSALALAHGSSQRSVQRALAALDADGRVRAWGRGRARRWLATPVAGFAPTLLLPGTLAGD